jgi:hypothetical protein
MVWRLNLLDSILQKGVSLRFVQCIKGFLTSRHPRVCLNHAYSQTWTMRNRVLEGSVLAPLFVIDDLQDYLPRGVPSSFHSPSLDEEIPLIECFDGVGRRN